MTNLTSLLVGSAVATVLLATGCDFNPPPPKQASVALPPLPPEPAKPRPSRTTTDAEPEPPDLEPLPSDGETNNPELDKGKLNKVPALRPLGLRWGLSPNEVAIIYEKVIDKEYLPRWAKVEPGVQMQQLEQEIADRKYELRRDQVDFDGTPSGYESTPFRNEFTQNTGESVLRIQRAGKKRHIFFINDKAWKVMDVYPLGEGSRWGADFPAAVAKITTVMNAPEGIHLKEDPGIGRIEEVVWTDGKTILRLMNMGGGELCIGYVDRATADRISELRKQ